MDLTQDRYVEYKRVNVAVYVKFSAEGGMIPVKVVWTDGRCFEIDRVTSVERAPNHVGAILPVRYGCVIGGAVRHLYFEAQHEQWFVETRI